MKKTGHILSKKSVIYAKKIRNCSLNYKVLKRNSYCFS